jgi:hypothetical protein
MGDEDHFNNLQFLIFDLKTSIFSNAIGYILL